MRRKTFSCVLAAILGFSLAAAGFSTEIRTADFVRFEGEPQFGELVKATGNLGGYGGKDSTYRVLGTFYYEFSVPEDGWYRISAPNSSGVEYELDRETYGVAAGVFGSFFLKSGKHSLMIRKRNWFHPWKKVEKIVVESAPEGLGNRIHLTGRQFCYEGIIAKGGRYVLELSSGASRNREISIQVRNRATGVVAGTMKIPVPAGAFKRTEVAIPAPQAGIFDFDFLLDGKKLDLPKFSMAVIDTAPVKSAIGGEIQKTLIQTIDCAAEKPDYEGGGETRVIKKQFGSYRESGNVSWLSHMNGNEPSWFAYRIDVPEAGRQYLVEVDYPDDAYRTYAVAVRNSGQTTYPIAGGVDCGHEYPLSNRIRTMTLLFWAPEKPTRLVVANASDEHRGAAAKIRLFRIDSKPLPQLIAPDVKGRDFANWYEEGTSFIGLYGGDWKNRRAEEYIPAADRWADTFGYMGGNVLYPTLMVYQFGLSPSDCNVWATRATTDLAEVLLLTAEKYGMKVMFDFHPEARDLRFDPARPNALRSRSGDVSTQPPLYGPLHPENRKWLFGMVREFVNRYSHSPAFKGISIRHMKWCNPALDNFDSLDWGYDDVTAELFEKEAGVSIPGIRGKDDPDRFARRYEFLTSDRNRGQWIAWRCRKVAELYRELAEILRQARPDLVLQCDAFTKEGGIDPAQLAKIDNLVITSGIDYGRRGRGESNRLDFLRKMLDPDPDWDMIHFGSAYFEANSLVIPPQQLGFPEGTRANWMSAVVNPSGRLMLERFALALALVDSKALQDGGNAYTVGQPELRDFMREFRVLPEADFKIAVGASDPVCVRQCGDKFYAVNMMPFPMECAITLANPGPATSLRSGEQVDVGRLELAAYELRGFSAASPVKTVVATPPAAELEKMKNQLAALGEAAERAPEAKRDELVTLYRQCDSLLKSGRLWRFRTTLEVAGPLLDSLGILLPDYYHDGFPYTPEGALSAKALQSAAAGKTELASSSAFLSDWNSEQVLTAAPGEALKVKVEVPVTGTYRLKLGMLCGGQFGSCTVFQGGTKVGEIPFTGKNVDARDVLLSRPLALRSGSAELDFVPAASKRVGISYLQLTPAYTSIPPLRWKVSPDFGKREFDEVLEPERTRDNTNWTALSGFKPFVDISCGVPVQDGTVRYAVTYLHSPDARRVRLSYGIDYLAKIWLNRNAVKPTGKRLKRGAPVRGEEFLDVDLKPGWNELLLKIGSGSGANGFWMDISNLDDLRFSTSPEEAGPRNAVIPKGGVMLHHQDFEKKVAQTKLTVWDGGGEHSFLGKGAAQMGNYFGGAKVTGGKSYLLQAYARGVRDGQGSRIQINWMNAEGKLVKHDLAGTKLTTDWQKIEVSAKAPPTAVSAHLIVGTDSGGEWVDEVWFGEVPPSQSTPKGKE